MRVLALHLLLCKGDRHGISEPEELAAFLESVLNQHGFHLIEDIPLRVNSLLQGDESINRAEKPRALLKIVPGKTILPHFLAIYCIFMVNQDLYRALSNYDLAMRKKNGDNSEHPSIF